MTSRDQSLSASSNGTQDGNVPISTQTVQSLAQAVSNGTFADEALESLPHTSNASRAASVSVNESLPSTLTSDASIVLIGVRGSGKRSLGFIAATALGRRFITEDHYFSTKTGSTRQEYLKLHGSEEFHKHDVEISRQMLEEHRRGCVIDCGLGSLTSSLQDYLREYSLTNPVVHVLRDMNSIRTLLKLSDRSMKLLENGDLTHRRCSNLEYFNIEDDLVTSTSDLEGLDRGSPTYVFKLRQAQADFSHFVKMITSATGFDISMHPAYSLDSPVYCQPYTHALRVPFSAYEDRSIDLAKLESGGDVTEILIDRWRPNCVKILSRMVADIRRNLKASVLITVAHKWLGLSSDMYHSVLKHSLRLAVNFVAIDLDMSADRLAELRASRHSTTLIADVELTSSGSEKSPWTDGTATRHVQNATDQQFDMIRLSYHAKSKSDNEHVRQFVRSLEDRKLGQRPVVIAYNIGQIGRTSQVFNRNLTSVTHQELQNPTLTGGKLLPDISAYSAMQALFSSFVFDPLRFCIIGGNVSGSLSPVMHNAAYRQLGLNHTYVTRNIKSWDDVEDLAKNPNLGGASIVQPWKVRLVSKVAHLSEHARIIGAINTLIPLRCLSDGTIPDLEEQAANRNQAGLIGAWYGDNTDWIAMSTCISRSLSPRNVIQQKSTALVVGAGGMARSAIYALTKLGCKNVFIYNRTIQNAENLAKHFAPWLSGRDGMLGSRSMIRVIQSREEQWPADFSPPTMVISCVTHEHLEGNPDSNFTMPQAWLGSESGGVVLELAYMTRETPLIVQIKHHREATGRPWVVVDGIEALFEQALAQFEIMTGRPAPPRCMRRALNKAIQERQTFVADGEEFEVV